MSPLDLLLWAVAVALGAAGLTVILRNAPIIRGWVFEMKKPWACNVCMPIYTCAVLVAPCAYETRDWRFGLVYLAAYLLSHVILDTMSRPPPEGPPPLDLDFIEDD